ncbi:MAG TPA: putative ABC transporter permease [Candidatus Onthousia excrementipullorum]|uniref:ABC transporter permease n=1 Tax=Candidatus Onthousia excrementipullorum TaxID=2840884 RepID=A0A9D1DTA4_9FIRM|nr:putative ABC transporter permease [Candidatus Onthousia excrementipullorum]
MKKYKDYLNKDHNFDKKTMLGIFCLIIVISGMFGWLYEVVFYYFNSGMKEIYWRGGNFLPWINIYAMGAILIYVLTYKKRKNPLFVFIVSMISTGILEYIGGAFMEHIMHIKCWDYTNEILSFGNINGYVCLRSVLVFGISALLLMYLIVPLCFYLAKKMPRKTFLILSYTVCAIFIFDELYNLIFANLLNLPRASEVYKSLGFKYLYF